MKETSTSFGLKPEQVERLFRIGEDTKGSRRSMSRNQNKSEMLRRRLAEPLPLEQSQIDVLPAVLGRLCHTIGLLAGETVLSLVLNPSTDLSLIERIKLSAICCLAGARRPIGHRPPLTIENSPRLTQRQSSV